MNIRTFVAKFAIWFSENEGGGQRPFGTFPKINPFWRRRLSLIPDYDLDDRCESGCNRKKQHAHDAIYTVQPEKLDKSLNGSFQHSAFVVQSNYLKQSLFSNRTILVTDSQSWSGFCFLDQFKRNSVKWDTGTNKKIGQFNDKYKNQGHIESSIYLLEWFI